MVKLAVSLRLTSVQRTVSPRSARMGPRIGHLPLAILEREPANQQILSSIPERIGVHFKPRPANDEHSRHLAALYRDAPPRACSNQAKWPCQLAACSPSTSTGSRCCANGYD